jgi:V/A-type H+-transporting ATPase subunit C
MVCLAEEYVYAVTRVHIHEQKLLDRQELEHMINAGSVGEAVRFLTQKGWGSRELTQDDPDALIEFETNRLWSFMRELVEDLSVFDVFRTAKDFHNLKAAIKLAYSGLTGTEKPRHFMEHGAIDIEIIENAAKTHDFSALPQDMAKAGQAAYEALAHTRNGQACDVEIDYAALMAIDRAGKSSKSALMQRYAELTVDLANIKAAVRCCMMRKSREFIKRVIVLAGTLDAERLAAAAESSLDDICACLKGSAYEKAADELKKSLAAFERYCDDELIALIKPQRLNYFTIEPLAAYILARENEIKIVKLILSALQNHLSAGVLRERLRDTYV